MYCKKFSPNIFHITKCTNCFRQKEEHSTEALECNRPTRSIARSGYLFLAPDWDFSVPLNRTKRWQRRWFVLYDDGELKYSVDEHPDTIPQGSVDMCKVLEVTGAEQVTGHPHSLALTSPDRVTFVKATSREDARWWAELLAVFPRRHKRNATFPGGRASPSLPQLGRSASPQPPRPHHLACTSGPSPRTNFETPPLKEERDGIQKNDSVVTFRSERKRPGWIVSPTNGVNIESSNTRLDSYLISSGSPPTRDKLRCEDKIKSRRDWRNERFRDIATALTDRSPESSLALPAESLLHLKKGWLWVQNDDGNLIRRWVVLSCPTLNVYRDQDEHSVSEIVVELSTVTSYKEVATDKKYGFEIKWAGPSLILCAVTSGIRLNWLEALKKVAPLCNTVPLMHINNNDETTSRAQTPTRTLFLSSDEEYRTASECGRQGSEEWGDLPPSPSLEMRRTIIRSTKDRIRVRPKLPRSQSRQSTLDSTSTEELETYRLCENSSDSERQLAKALIEIQVLEEEIARLKKREEDVITRERKSKEALETYELREKELNQRHSQAELNFLKEQRILQKRLVEIEETSKLHEEKSTNFAKELQTKQRLVFNLQEQLANSNERLEQSVQENEQIYKRLKQLNGKMHQKCIHVDSLTDLTNINLDLDIEELGQSELKEYCLDLRGRFEKAVLEIRAVKRELKESYEKCDNLELENYSLIGGIEVLRKDSETQINLLVSRLEHLTTKLTQMEKQNRSKSKNEIRDRKRSLSLRTGREGFAISKEVEDKLSELETKLLTLERNSRSKRRFKRDRSTDRSSPIDDKSLRRLRRKSLDGSLTATEPIKLIMRLNSLETTVKDLFNNEANAIDVEQGRFMMAQTIVKDSLEHARFLIGGQNKRAVGHERFCILEQNLTQLDEMLNDQNINEIDVIHTSANTTVKQLHTLLQKKFIELAERKNELRNSGELDGTARVQILAEKVAFENILISRVQEALLAKPSDGICERLMHKELKETANLMLGLKLKLKGAGEKSPQVTHMTSVEYLTKVLTTCLLSATQNTTLISKVFKCEGPDIQLLRKEQTNLNTLMLTYKVTKLSQLAESLAIDTLLNQNSNPSSQICAFINENVLHNLNRSSTELVTAELVQYEIDHVLKRAAQIYQSSNDADHEYLFSFFACERVALELWSDSVRNRLSVLVDESIKELSELYSSKIAQMENDPSIYSDNSIQNQKVSSMALLNEFADIIAHKALIDARINVLSDTVGQDDRIRCEQSTDKGCYFLEWLNNDWNWEQLDMQTFVQMNQSLECEFNCMFSSNYKSNNSSRIESLDLFDINQHFKDVNVQVSKLEKYADISSDNGEDVNVQNWSDVREKCQLLWKKLESICTALFLSDKVHEEQIPLYFSHVEKLRNVYQNAIATSKATEDEIKLDELRVLSERTILAVEQWYRRIIQQLRQMYIKDMEALKKEKEQALAEETQATLAALDAMRKAQEAEVQREVLKLQQELTRQKRNDFLNLSEQLSAKCMDQVDLNEEGSCST